CERHDPAHGDVTGHCEVPLFQIWTNLYVLLITRAVSAQPVQFCEVWVDQITLCVLHCLRHDVVRRLPLYAHLCVALSIHYVEMCGRIAKRSLVTLLLRVCTTEKFFDVSTVIERLAFQYEDLIIDIVSVSKEAHSVFELISTNQSVYV